MTVTTTSLAGAFCWKPEYSVRDESIDAQHRQLVALINALHTAMMEGRGKQQLTETLDRLIRYTVEHFKFEEEYMQRNGYPGIAGHRREHQDLARQVTELRRDFVEGRLTITFKVMDFLKQWLHSHILGSDARYASHVAGRTAR